MMADQWRAELRKIADVVSKAELPDLIGELARAQAIASARLQQDDRPIPTSLNGNDRWLTAHETSDLLAISEKWCYAHQDELGAAKIGGAVRFSERAIRRYVAIRKERRSR